jgi:16S rRNA pseudouridine516 synthase
MQSKRTRLDRFISVNTKFCRRDVKLMLAQNRIQVDGLVAESVQQIIDEFTHVVLDGTVLQANTARYLMLNKPIGVVSATKDKKHKTVIDLLDASQREDLHIAGRLDLNSTGLLLLTNNGRWSKQLSHPEQAVAKRYSVTVENTLTDDYIAAFANGMHFPYEDIITRSATLKIISDYVAEVTLTEGRYHQIKRMFGRFQNKVLKLHRESIGNLPLDPRLKPGQYRELTHAEAQNLFMLSLNN